MPITSGLPTVRELMAITVSRELHIYFRLADNSELMAVRASMMTYLLASDYHVSSCGSKPLPEKHSSLVHQREAKIS